MLNFILTMLILQQFFKSIRLTTQILDMLFLLNYNIVNFYLIFCFFVNNFYFFKNSFLSFINNTTISRITIIAILISHYLLTLIYLLTILLFFRYLYSNIIMQRIFIASLTSIILLLTSKKERSFKFINFAKKETIKKKAQRKINTNKRVKMQTLRIKQTK